MKILIDENLPKRLKQYFSNHSIFTVHDMKWQSKSNGELLKMMESEGFDILFTFDKNLQYQQNIYKYSIIIIVFDTYDNSFESLEPYLGEVGDLLNSDLSNKVYVIDKN